MTAKVRRRLPLWSLACTAFVMAASWPAWGDKPRPATLVKGPYLTGLSEGGVDVRFELDGASPAALDVGRDRGDAPRGADAGGSITYEDHATTALHVVHATGLEPASRYAYTVRVGGKAVGQGRFTTAPRPNSEGPLTFLVYGDDRTDPTAHAAVVRALAATSSDFLVNTGDMVEDGGRAADWQSFFDVEARLLCDRALFVAIGNHELYDDRAGANFARYFGFADAAGSVQLHGSVRLGNVRLFFLNAVQAWGAGEDPHWLERELDRAENEPGLLWRIAVMHQGPWSSGPHGGNAILIKARVPELLAAHHVDLLFAGHDHIYERGDAGGMKYVISGGGGAPLYRTSKIASTRKEESTYHFIDVTTEDNAISMVAKRIDGSLLERCGFRKGEAWDCDAPGSGSNLAPAPSSTTPAARSSARCGCALPGAGPPLASGGLLATAIALVCWWRKRQGSG
jgi:acid phosphatase type 7